MSIQFFHLKSFLTHYVAFQKTERYFKDLRNVDTAISKRKNVDSQAAGSESIVGTTIHHTRWAIGEKLIHSK